MCTGSIKPSNLNDCLLLMNFQWVSNVLMAMSPKPYPCEILYLALKYNKI